MKNFRRLCLFFGLAAGTGALAGCDLARSKWAEGMAALEKMASNRSLDATDPILARIGKETVRQSEVDESGAEFFPPGNGSRAPSALLRLKTVQALAARKRIVVLAHQVGFARRPQFETQRKMAEDFLLMRLYRNNLRSQIQISDADLHAYYNVHRREFLVGEVRASHILTWTVENARKAQDLLKSGEPFAAVARMLSVDPVSSRKDGKITNVLSGDLDLAFQKALAQLPAGKVSDIVKTSAGYELIRKDAEIQGSPRPFDSVKEDIRKEMLDQEEAKQETAAASKIPIAIDEQQLRLSSPSESH